MKGLVDGVGELAERSISFSLRSMSG